MGKLYGLDEEDPDPIIDEESHQRTVETGSLRPHGANADNRWLQAQEVHDFVPTRDELRVLAKFWMLQIIDYDFLLFCDDQPFGWMSRRSAFAGARIDRISGVIGGEAVGAAIEQAYKEYGEQVGNSEPWRVFMHGTADERSAFHAETDAYLWAVAQQHEDALYQKLIEFCEGRPHAFREGTLGFHWAKRARLLTRRSRRWAEPSNRARLLKAVRGY